MSEPIKALSRKTVCGLLTAGLLLGGTYDNGAYVSGAYAESVDTATVAPTTDYLDAIEAVEAEHSAYSPQLSDLYLSLGHAYVAQADFQSAKRAFERGMQIERINNGLYSITQRPFLLSLADTESYLGNWKQSRKALDNLYKINWQAYGDNDPRLLPVLDEILDWLLITYDRRTPTGGYENLIVAERIGETINTILTLDIASNSLDKSNKFRKLATLHYAIANHIRQHGDKNSSEVTFSSGQSNLNSRNLTSSHLHFQRGKRALENVVQCLVEEGEGSVTEQALAVAELGDWYLIFGQKQAAQRTYKLASDTLAKVDPEEAPTPSLFDKPNLVKFDIKNFLGENPEQTLDDVNGEKVHREKIEVEMTISKYGVISDVQVLNPPQEITKVQQANLRSNLRNTRFRPRIIDGETVESTHKGLLEASLLER